MALLTLGNMELDELCQDEVDKQTEIEDLIAELCLNSPSEAVKFCLRNYQYGRSLIQLEKDFSKQKRDVLRETADYLNIPGFMDKTKEPLAHLIICRIQNLMTVRYVILSTGSLTPRSQY